jgi:hypothetical protein
MRGYKDLLERVHDWAAFGDRMRGFVSVVKRRPNVREPALSAAEATRLCCRPGLAEEARETIAGIIGCTDRVAPFMMRRVKTAIVQFAQYRRTLEELYPQLDRQIRLESQNRFPIIAEDRPIAIPPAFRLAYRRLFKDVYRRAYLNITNKDLVPEALTEIFRDFLVRWGKSFERVEDHHAAFLSEICDRTCARFNGEAPQDFVPVTSDDLPVPEVSRTRLGDDVLKSVEQELFRIPAAGTRAP